MGRREWRDFEEKKSSRLGDERLKKKRKKKGEKEHQFDKRVRKVGKTSELIVVIADGVSSRERTRK